MPSPGYGENGSVIGPQNLPTSSAASGVWSLGEMAEASRDSIWPQPFDGFIAQFDPNFASQTLTYLTNVSLDSNGDLFVGFYSNTNPSGAYWAGGFAKINVAAKTLTDTRSFRIGTSYGTSFNTLLSNLTVDSAGSDDIYISGYTNASGTDGVWTAKLNSSYVEQWFGINTSDELFRRGASSQVSYTNYPASHRLSPNGSYLYAGGYGLNTGYDAMAVPCNPTTGVRLGANNITDSSNPSNMSFYFRDQALNDSNFMYVGFAYHSSYGAYHNTLFKVWNTGGSASGVGMRIDFNGGSYSGGSYLQSASVGDLYNTPANADRYPIMGHVVGGSGNNTAYFFRWNHATNWNTFDQGWRLTINASDSPVTPTAIGSFFGMTFSADDSTCYALMSG